MDSPRGPRRRRRRRRDCCRCRRHIAGSYVRGGLRLTPFRVLDSLGGLVLGHPDRRRLVWVLRGDRAAHARGHISFRRDMLSGRPSFNRSIPGGAAACTGCNFLARSTRSRRSSGPSPPTPPPSPAIAGNQRIRGRPTRASCKRARHSLRRRHRGSGWFARHDLVVTAAHVVAGEHDTYVEIQGSPAEYSATSSLRLHNHIAPFVCRTRRQPFPLADPQAGRSGRHSRLSGDGSLTGPRPDWPHRGRIHPGRLRQRPCLARDHRARGTHPPRRLRRADDRHARRRRGDDLRRPQGAPSGYAVPTTVVRSELARLGRAGVDRVLRTLGQNVECGERRPRTARPLRRPRAFPRALDQLAPDLHPDLASFPATRSRSRTCRRPPSPAPRCASGSSV